MDMGLKLKNHKVAESKLAKFVENIIIPPRMVDAIVDGEVNDEYMRTRESLSKKLKFVEVDPTVKASKTLNDVQPELEKLRQKVGYQRCLILLFKSFKHRGNQRQTSRSFNKMSFKIQVCHFLPQRT